MFYILSELKDVFFGFNIFRYITFRAAMAAVTAFTMTIVFGPWFTRLLKDKRIREYAKRTDCPDLDQFAESKNGIPTMGGILMIGSILAALFLWADITNRYVLLILGVCVYLAVLGVCDDYLKLIGKFHTGLKARTKFLWQILLACFVGSYIYFDPASSTTLDIPFLKNVSVAMGIVYLPLVALIIIGTTNAVNITDGLDGLAIGCILIVSLSLGVLCYLSGHAHFSEYLFIPYIPMAAELTIICSAMVGASLGFLWFNCFPATIFMGDTGSLPLGGMIAVIAVLIKKELLLVFLGGVFVMETLSVILQIISYKTRRKRIFKVSPLHHHLQLCGWKESKIIVRFWIINIILAVIALITLKVR